MKTIEELRENLQKFVAAINREPKENEIGRTPDGKAKTLPISFVEMTLDEYFFGLWETKGFQWNVIANEVVGSIELTVTHPISGEKLTRTGAAAIQIMVDKAPDNIHGADKNRWALNPDNKKSNALDMGFPKLKAECVKNAAQSLGKLFGRDLNRKQADVFKPLIKPEKKELSPESAEWSAVAMSLSAGNVTIEQVRTGFLLSKENEELLLNSKAVSS